VVAAFQVPSSTGLGGTYELILLTDLLTADLDNHGHRRTEPPSATPASRPARQLRTGLDGRNLAMDQMIGRCSQESALCPPRARKGGHPRRFTISHGATGSALDLCNRRSTRRVHLLCKQGVRGSSPLSSTCFAPVLDGGEVGWCCGRRGCPGAHRPGVMRAGPPSRIGEEDPARLAGGG
jgi:hypothetical protein